MMLLRLTLFAVVSIALCLTLALAIRVFFGDVMPVAWSDVPQPFWRLETAVLLTTLQWITGVVGLLCAAGAMVLQYRRIFSS
jgi:hypothetical protein